MPARVIRSEINTSDSLARVSLLADLFFRALLLECDDYGRMDGRPAILKAALFPLRADYTPEVIEACIEELSSGEKPPLLRFHVGGRPYLCLTGWEHHRGKGKRAERSKYPDPPHESETGSQSPRIPADPRGSARGSARLTSDDWRLTIDDKSAGASPPASPPPKRQARAVPEVPSEAHAFAQDFRDALLKIHAGFKPPSANAFARWRQEARLLLAADERPPEEARDLASWLFTDPGEEAAFWRGNVLSVQKFRQKYDQLRAQQQRAEERKRGAAHRGSTLLALAYT